MNTLQFAERILNLSFEFKDDKSTLKSILHLEEELFESTVKKFYQDYNPDRKADAETTEKVHDVLNKINLINYTDLIILPSKKINKICYRTPGCLFYAFIQDDHIWIAKHIRTKYVLNMSFPLKEGLISNYNDEQLDDTNIHNKTDLLLKLKNSTPYQKSNYFIYAIRKYMHINGYHFHDPDDSFLHYALAKIYATAFLNKTNPEKLILDDILITKQILINKMEKYHTDKTKELNEIKYCLNQVVPS